MSPLPPIPRYVQDPSKVSLHHPMAFPPALYVAPYVALPITLVASLFCPPFRWRGSIFAASICVALWASTASPWPPNDGPLRPMRYGLACSWTFVLPVLEKLLVLVPERDCQRLEDKDARPPPDFSWAKLRWALALFATPRGVGWTHGSTGPNAAREKMRQQQISRARFVFGKIMQALLYYVVLDAIILAARKAEFQESWAWDALTVGMIVYGDVLMAATVYVTMTMQFDLAAAIGVSLYLSKPEDWPPLFGDITTCFTVANVWGKFWHGYIRQPVLGFSHLIVRKLSIPRGSTLAYLVHLTTAFAISAFFHGLSLSVICSGYLAVKDLVTYMAIFFMSQPVATLVETLAIRVYRNLVLHQHQPAPGDTALSPNIQYSPVVQFASQAVSLVLGYAWVLSWFTFTGWWFTRAYVSLGVMRWQLPFSLIQKVLFPAN